MNSCCCNRFCLIDDNDETVDVTAGAATVGVDHAVTVRREKGGGDISSQH